MKQRFTTGVLMMLAVFALSLTSCKDDKEEVKPAVEETEIGCKLTEVAFDEDVPGKIEYNERGYITKVTFTYVEDDGTVEKNVVTYSYNSAEQVIRMDSHLDGVLVQHTIYEYKDNLLAVEKDYNEAGELRYSTTYEYDEKKRRIAEEGKVHPGGTTYTTRYTYDEKDNVVKTEDFFNGEPDGYAVYSNYDDKPTPFSLLKGLPASDEEGLSKNNPGNRTVYSNYDSSGSKTSEWHVLSARTFTYEYNSNGYPTKITKSYDDGDKYVDTFTYECK